MRSKILICALTLALSQTLAAQAGKPSFPKREYQRQYREILQRYSTGDREGAVETLVEIEAGYLGTGGDAFVEPLRKAKLRVINDLLPADIDVLLPVIALHERAYLAARDLGLKMLFPQARSMVIELIELYAGNVETAAGRTYASLLSTSMAGHLQAAKVDATAAGLYRRALELDRDNPAALAGLAFIHEQYGEYEDAVRYLERLVEIDAVSGAAQLRLGITLVRLGRVETGTIFLRDVLAAKHPAWMRSVAYQELGRILADEGELRRARALLEEGVRDLPGDPSLLIQLAYLCERTGSFSEDPALREALQHPTERAQQPSPRFLYGQMPTVALAEVRRTLDRENKDKLYLLARALPEGRNTGTGP